MYYINYHFLPSSENPKLIVNCVFVLLQLSKRPIVAVKKSRQALKTLKKYRWILFFRSDSEKKVARGFFFLENVMVDFFFLFNNFFSRAAIQEFVLKLSIRPDFIFLYCVHFDCAPLHRLKITNKIGQNDCVMNRLIGFGLEPACDLPAYAY